jgi:hypothetical protein
MVKTTTLSEIRGVPSTYTNVTNDPKKFITESETDQLKSNRRVIRPLLFHLLRNLTKPMSYYSVFSRLGGNKKIEHFGPSDNNTNLTEIPSIVIHVQYFKLRMFEVIEKVQKSVIIRPI